VVDVARNSPLDQAGVGPGDAIKEMIIGPPAAGGARFEGVFERADGATAKVAYRWVEQVEPGVAISRLPSGRLLLRFDHFDVESVDWLLQQLRSAPPQGVVLDLRQNAGGNVSEKRKMLGAVLGPRLPVGVRLDGTRTVEKSAGRMIYTGPLAILVGPNSASAAEASADILHHYDRAILVGERTAGSVLISRTFDLPGGEKIQVPVASFETLDGDRLEGRGVAPDCDVRQTLAAIRAGRDLVIEAAERALDARASVATNTGGSWSSVCYST
jgi:carboxyl-terminal processing protease